MAVLATLKRDRLGEWASLSDYLAELRRRETSSVAALANLLAAPPEEQRELGQGEGLALLVEIASDLRMPKGSRLAAARCAVEAGISGPALGELFVGAGDLSPDPRLGGAAKKLVESGLKAALSAGTAKDVSFEAGAFARAAQAGASAVGQARVKELLGGAPAGHAGATAAFFALGTAELPEAQKTSWAKFLEKTCIAHRSAPAAAKRMGLAPPWPPNLPESFAPLVEAAEKAAAGIVAADAAAGPVKSGSRPPPPARTPLRPASPSPAPPNPPAAPARPRPIPTGATEVGRKTLAPIKPSPFRRPLGTVVEGPVTVPPKAMPAIAPRGAAPRQEPHPGKGPLPIAPLVRRDEPLRFDPGGKRIPRSDRWSEHGFGWEQPVLPSSEAPPVRKAPASAGPFAPRLKSLFDDRPEAVERLCAAVEARAALVGLRSALDELSRELAHPRWKARRAPPGQLERLAALGDPHPEPWKAAAGLLLERLRIQAG